MERSGSFSLVQGLALVNVRPPTPNVNALRLRPCQRELSNLRVNALRLTPRQREASNPRVNAVRLTPRQREAFNPRVKALRLRPRQREASNPTGRRPQVDASPTHGLAPPPSFGAPPLRVCRVMISAAFVHRREPSRRPTSLGPKGPGDLGRGKAAYLARTQGSGRFRP